VDMFRTAPGHSISISFSLLTFSNFHLHFKLTRFRRMTQTLIPLIRHGDSDPAVTSLAVTSRPDAPSQLQPATVPHVRRLSAKGYREEEKRHRRARTAGHHGHELLFLPRVLIGRMFHVNVFFVNPCACRVYIGHVRTKCGTWQCIEFKWK